MTLKLGIFMMLLFSLSACQPSQTADSSTSESGGGGEHTKVESTASEGDLAATTTSQDPAESQTLPSDNVRPDGIPHAWTDYSAYATPNEEGYAYYIHDDPDVSSEIFSMDPEVSSQDVMLFTFDDAPQMPDSYAIEMAELMKSKDVNAIFLVNGMYLDTPEGQEITRTIHEMGFEIGNHTETHPDLRNLTYEEQYYELKTTNDKIVEITGQPVRWFRPPFGSFNFDTIYVANELGLQLMTWTFGFDWMDEYLNGPALTEISLNNKYIHGGANILMHDRSWTLEALPAIIDGYREMGYHIVDPYLIKHQANSEEPL